MEVLTSSRVRIASEPGPAHRQSGFSLVELLVAMVILAFVALSVFGALDYGMTLNGSSRDYTTVSNLAKSRLEQIVALPFRAAALNPGTTFTEVTPDGLFTIDYVVREHTIGGLTTDPTAAFLVDTPGVGNVKVITLTASARGIAPGIRSVTVEAVKHVR